MVARQAHNLKVVGSNPTPVTLANKMCNVNSEERMIMTREAQMMLSGLTSDSRRVVLAEARYLARGSEVTVAHIEAALASLGRSQERPTQPVPIGGKRCQGL